MQIEQIVSMQQRIAAFDVVGGIKCLDKKRFFLTLTVALCVVGIASAKFQPKPFVWDIKYRGEVNVGAAFGGEF